jgi:hypothetical protein
MASMTRLYALLRERIATLGPPYTSDIAPAPQSVAPRPADGQVFATTGCTNAEAFDVVCHMLHAKHGRKIPNTPAGTLNRLFRKHLTMHHPALAESAPELTGDNSWVIRETRPKLGFVGLSRRLESGPKVAVDNGHPIVIARYRGLDLLLDGNKRCRPRNEEIVVEIDEVFRQLIEIPQFRQTQRQLFRRPCVHDPAHQVGEVELAVAPRAHKPGIVLACCDALYYRKFAATLIETAKRNSPNQHVHVHVYEPDEAWKAEARDTAAAHAGLTLSWEDSHRNPFRDAGKVAFGDEETVSIKGTKPFERELARLRTALRDPSVKFLCLQSLDLFTESQIAEVLQHLDRHLDNDAAAQPLAVGA